MKYYTGKPPSAGWYLCKGVEDKLGIPIPEWRFFNGYAHYSIYCDELENQKNAGIAARYEQWHYTEITYSDHWPIGARVPDTRGIK